MNAAICFTERLASQGVEIPHRLERELHLRCMLPYLSIFDLWDRLVAGCRVLDRHGEIDAPDHLWQRWEAIFIAWQCCEEACIAADSERSNPTPELETQPVNRYPKLHLKGPQR